MFGKPEKSWLEEELERERKQSHSKESLWDRIAGIFEPAWLKLFRRMPAFKPTAVPMPTDEQASEVKELSRLFMNGGITANEFRRAIAEYTDGVLIGNTYYLADRNELIEAELKGPYGIHWV